MSSCESVDQKQVEEEEGENVVGRLVQDQQSKFTGHFGTWQLTICLVTGLSIMIHGWQMLANKWLTWENDHWCSRSGAHTKLDSRAWINISAPMLNNGEFDRCRKFDIDYSDPHLTRPSEDTATVACDSWEYDRSEITDSAVERWDLVCDRRYFRRVVQMAFFLGNMVGVLAVGPASDWFGRKVAYMGMMTLWMIFGVAGYFATDPYIWLAIRFCCGATSLAFNTAVAVYRIELVSGKWRSRVSHWFGEAFWSIGQITLGLLVWGVPNMHLLELIIGLSALPFMSLWFLLPESPRWLLSKGKTMEADKVLRRACKVNKMSTEGLEEFVKAAAARGSDETVDKKVKKAHMHQLFQYPGVRRNTLIIFICWMAFSMGYFGLVYNTPAFDANKYLVFVLPALIMLPLAPFQPLLDNGFGRKKIITSSLLAGGVILLLTLAFPRGDGQSDWPIIVAAWLGQVTCGFAFSVGYVYTNELFPTTHRTLALSLSSAGARVGSVSSPAIAMLDTIHPIAPLVVYGVIVLLAGVLSIWLWPETKDIRIMQA